MANALPQAIGAQAAFPDRQVVAFSGDGGLAMLMGELLTLRQQRLPVKIVVLNNGSLGFVELEMKADGIVNFGTDLDNPDFAEVARAVGIHGIRVDRPADLDAALTRGLRPPGPRPGRRTRPTATSSPSRLRVTVKEAAGFTLWATRSVLNGDASAVLDVARTNLRQLGLE